MNTKFLFITGTDTEVGKTFVACEIAKRLIQQGHTVGVSKPFGTGAEEMNGNLMCPDTLALQEAAGVKDNMHAITPVLYHSPLAPNWAARIENKPVDVQAAKDSIERLAPKYSHFIVEGIGGVQVPLTDDYFVSDFIAEYNFPTLLVSHISLGTLNHSLLSLQALQLKNIPIVGVLLNGCVQTHSSLAEQSNEENLATITDVPVFGTIPHKPIGTQLSTVIDKVISAAF